MSHHFVFDSRQEVLVNPVEVGQVGLDALHLILVVVASHDQVLFHVVEELALFAKKLSHARLSPLRQVVNDFAGLPLLHPRIFVVE